MDNAPPYVIEMLHITKEFPGIKANDDITLQLKKGEIHALLGENGAGKSTTMKMILGLAKPTSGTVTVLGKTVKIVGPGVKTGLNILMDNPAQVGSDRIVNAVAAINEYPAPLIIIDMGTATTFCVVDEKKNYIGGMILPGVRISLDALTSRTSQLSRISIEAPKKTIGKNTIDCMKSGIINGNAACIDGMVQRIERELGQKATVLATGGLAKKIVPYCEQKIIVDDELLLKGLRLIYNKNK